MNYQQNQNGDYSNMFGPANQGAPTGANPAWAALVQALMSSQGSQAGYRAPATPAAPTGPATFGAPATAPSGSRY